MFYLFRQNNTFGTYDIDEESGIGADVLIEADSPEEANERAKEIGIYFDGVDIGIDCPCCGDRWYPVTEADAYKSPKEAFSYRRSNSLFIHYKDGRITRG